jgi:IclR family pca regulon transcriptional regulator
MKKFTAKTIDTLDKLKKEVQKVRDQGYTVNDEEVEVGGRCIAAPLMPFGYTGVIQDFGFR